MARHIGVPQALKNKQMQALFLTKYGHLAASTRYRFEQFFPGLEAEGIHCEIAPLLTDEYLKQRFANKPFPWSKALAAFFNRAQAVLESRKFDVVVVHCELFPYLPPIFESWLKWRGMPYIFDFDDAIHHQYDHHSNPLIRKVLGKKTLGIISGAAAVWAGNDYLAAYAKNANPNVTIVPTVVDLKRYTPKEKFLPGSVTIGWMGSPSTAKYVKAYTPVFQTFLKNPGRRLIIVGAGELSMDFPFESRPWTEANEITDLHDFDIGIMPLMDTVWERGKCGFKLIQYMGCGIPVVASPVGVNKMIVDHGGNGYLATTETEWVQYLTLLATDPDLRKKMGKAAREKVAKLYSTKSVFPVISEQLQRASRKNQ